MSGYSLSDTRTRTAQTNPPRSISLFSIVDSSPEPTTTASGVIPGQALLDNHATTAEVDPVSKPESTRRYPQRPRFSTKWIAQYNEDRAKLKEARKNRKPRKKSSTTSLASAASEQTTTDNDRPDSRPSSASVAHDTMGGTTTAPPGGGNGADGAVRQPCGEASGVRGASANQVPGIPANSGTASGVGHVKGRGDRAHLQNLTGSGEAARASRAPRDSH
ncbi:hypothetical protein FRC08_003219 [Ceratobasidium sp. 394]|nr:hypothetical protein FRC08_003219 [Ceratobasidium sp. 394]